MLSSAVSSSQGLIDAEKELGRLEERRARLTAQLRKLRDAAEKPDYTAKVPEHVRAQNSDKVRGKRAREGGRKWGCEGEGERGAHEEGEEGWRSCARALIQRSKIQKAGRLNQQSNETKSVF